MATHGLLGLLAAVLLVGGTVLLDRWFGGPASDLNTVGPALTVLGTVVTFFAVATLAVSVSLTLLQSAAGLYNSDVVEYFAEDPDRETLLHLIFLSFLVSLANLCLLATGLLHPFSSLILPVSLAGLTLLLMVGYISERVRLFSAQGLTKRLAAETEREIAALRTAQSGAAKEAWVRASQGLNRLASLTQSLCKAGRMREAETPLFRGARLMADFRPVSYQKGFWAMDAYWQFWEVIREATKDGDRRLAGLWLSPGFKVKSTVEDALPVLGNLSKLAQVLEDGKSTATEEELRGAAGIVIKVLPDYYPDEIYTKWGADFILAEEIIKACGQVASVYWTDRGGEASEVERVALGVVNKCLELVPDYWPGILLQAVHSNFHSEILGHQDFADLAPRVREACAKAKAEGKKVPDYSA